MAENPRAPVASPSTARLLAGAVLLGLGFTPVAMLLPSVGHVDEHPERLPAPLWLVRFAGFGAYAIAGGWIGYRLRQRRPDVPLPVVLRLALVAGLLLAAFAALLGHPAELIGVLA